MIDMRTATVKEIALYFSHETNGILFRPEEIICWIRVLSDYAYRTGLRNERPAQVGRKLAGIPLVKKKMESASNRRWRKWQR